MRDGEIKTFSAVANGSASGVTSRGVLLIADEWGTGPAENLPSPGNIDCERCGTRHGLHTDCQKKAIKDVPFTASFKFNNLHLSHLPVKIDGHCEHLFVAILNGEAVGQAIALKQPWGACGLRMLFVTPKHRHKGIGSRLVSRVQVFAHNEGCKAVEIAVHKGNAEARQFWIRRRFIDMEEERQSTEGYTCMEKAIKPDAAPCATDIHQPFASREGESVKVRSEDIPRITGMGGSFRER